MGDDKRRLEDGSGLGSKASAVNSPARTPKRSRSNERPASYSSTLLPKRKEGLAFSIPTVTPPRPSLRGAFTQGPQEQRPTKYPPATVSAESTVDDASFTSQENSAPKFISFEDSDDLAKMSGFVKSPSVEERSEDLSIATAVSSYSTANATIPLDKSTSGTESPWERFISPVNSATSRSTTDAEAQKQTVSSGSDAGVSAENSGQNISYTQDDANSVQFRLDAAGYSSQECSLSESDESFSTDSAETVRSIDELTLENTKKNRTSRSEQETEKVANTNSADHVSVTRRRALKKTVTFASPISSIRSIPKRGLGKKVKRSSSSPTTETKRRRRNQVASPSLSSAAMDVVMVEELPPVPDFMIRRKRHGEAPAKTVAQHGERAIAVCQGIHFRRDSTTGKSSQS